MSNDLSFLDQLLMEQLHRTQDRLYRIPREDRDIVRSSEDAWAEQTRILELWERINEARENDDPWVIRALSGISNAALEERVDEIERLRARSGGARGGKTSATKKQEIIAAQDCEWLPIARLHKHKHLNRYRRSKTLFWKHVAQNIREDMRSEKITPHGKDSYPSFDVVRRRLQGKL